MSYIKAVYLDLNQCCNDFIKGVALLEQCSVNESVEYFKRACETASGSDRFFPKYQSYYGFSRILSGEAEAIQICRGVASRYPFDGDIHMNLVRAEMFLNNRLAALNSIEAGLRFSAQHDGLQKLKLKLGVRLRKPLPLLSRNNLISVAVGRCMRKSHK